MMLLRLLDRLGNWNPQLFRELKGRLTPRNLAIAGSASVGGQLTLMGSLFQHWYTKQQAVYGPYCALAETYNNYHNRLRNFESEPHIGLSGEVVGSIEQESEHIRLKLAQMPEACPTDAIDYSAWWMDFGQACFGWLTLAALFLFLGGLIYLLIRDVSKEKHQGTLKFIQLSPQSTHTFLLGKLLGVPILVYGAIALTLPLHFGLSQTIHVPWWQIIGFYVAILASACCFGLVAILLGLFGAQAIIGTAGLMFGIFLLCVASNMHDPTSLTTYLSLFAPTLLFPRAIDLGNNDGLPYWLSSTPPFNFTTLPSLLLVLFNCGLVIYWLSQPLQRRFRTPQSPLWSKGQSYGITFSLSLLFIGGDILLWGEKSRNYSDGEQWLQIILFQLMLMAIWVVVLCPNRATLIEWARYRYEQASRSRLGWAMLWQDASPATLAIVCHTVLAFIPFAVWVGVTGSMSMTDRGLLISGLAFVIVQLWLYGAIAQLIHFLSRQHTVQKVLLTLAFLTLGVPFALFSAGVLPATNPTPWLLTSFFWLGLEQYPTLVQIGIGWVGNLGLVLLCNAVLAHRLRLAGRSDFKLLTDG
ncbi:MAG: hypothetical protein AAGG51_05990 [Cyanobacteria bacterium P01_G01_bin.54]